MNQMEIMLFPPTQIMSENWVQKCLTSGWYNKGKLYTVGKGKLVPMLFFNENHAMKVYWGLEV
jgi:hypothetical protein